MGASSSVPATPGACAAGNTTFAGRVCSMQCGIDYPGGDYKVIQVPKYMDCLQACASDAVCSDSQYDQRNGICYLKSTLTTPVGSPGIDSAVCYIQRGAEKSFSSSTAPVLTTTVTLTATAVSTTTATSTTTAVSTTTATSTTTAVSTTTATSTTTSISTTTATSSGTTTATVTSINTTTATATSTVTTTLSTACPSTAAISSSSKSSSTAFPSTVAINSLSVSLSSGFPSLAAMSEPSISGVCTFTITATATSYTATTTMTVVPTKCYNTAILRSLQSSQPSVVTPSSSASQCFIPPPYCSAATIVSTTTTVAGIATSVDYQPFYIQATNVAVNNGNYARIAAFNFCCGPFLMQFTAPARGPAIPWQLNDDCVLQPMNRTFSRYVAAIDQSGQLYIDETQRLNLLSNQRGGGGPSNTSCVVSASSILTCATRFGNSTFLNGAPASSGGEEYEYNNDLFVLPANTTNNLYYPVTLALTFF